MKDVDFMENAVNVYSTAKYIVAQNIHIVVDCDGKHYLTTIDRFYKRNPKRDKQYATLFLTDTAVSGGRINCEITKRIYVD